MTWLQWLRDKLRNWFCPKPKEEPVVEYWPPVSYKPYDGIQAMYNFIMENSNTYKERDLNYRTSIHNKYGVPVTYFDFKRPVCIANTKCIDNFDFIGELYSPITWEKGTTTYYDNKYKSY